MVGWDAEVGWLGVVITPGGEIIVALAGAAVDLDLDTTHLRHRELSAHHGGEKCPEWLLEPIKTGLIWLESFQRLYSLDL